MKKLAMLNDSINARLCVSVRRVGELRTQSSIPKEVGAVNLTGQVSCSRFGRGSVSARKEYERFLETIQVCAQRYDYTLVSGKQIYRLTGDTNLLAKMSGKTVTLEGRFYQGTTKKHLACFPVQQRSPASVQQRIKL